MEDEFKIGDVVIAGGWVCQLLEYSEQAKRIGEPILVDTNWVPSLWSHPDPKGSGVFLYIGDELTILSGRIIPPEGCPYYLYHVQDKDGNKFYLSAMYIKHRPKQLSLPF